MDIEFEKGKFLQALTDHGIRNETDLYKALGNLTEKQQYILRTWINLVKLYDYERGVNTGKVIVQNKIKDALGILDEE